MNLLTVLLAIVLICSGSAPSFAEASEGKDTPPLVGQKGVQSVTAFGAKGDGTSDDTAAFQKALDAVSKDGGGIVFVPTGNYLIKGHLSIPDHVTMEGVFRAPTRSTQYKGSTLLAVEGKGKEDGEPFIFLHTNSTLKGITIFYPEQDKKSPVPYPWCVRGAGDNCSIIDVLMVNPWQAVDFGTFPCGRHLIRGLYAQALHTGIFVDKCFDVGRIEDVHLWPFWEIPLNDFVLKQGTAFIFGRTDWEFVTNTFCISYKTGFQFTAFKDWSGNVLLTNSGADMCTTAVLVEQCQDLTGIAWTNCQFFGGIDIRETNAGPVKFNNCSLWGLEPSPTIVSTKGAGTVTFNGCHFARWDFKGEGQPAILADGARLTVTSCEFIDGGKKQIVLGPNSKSAVIVGNRFRGGVKVDNQGEGKVEMGLNVDD